MALSSLSLAINSSTEPTFKPPCLAGGSSSFKISSLFSIETPKSSTLSFSKGFFLAFIIFGSVTNLGSFNLKSVVIIIGKDALTTSTPPSISRSTSTVESLLILTFDAFVACGQLSRPASIWPVWFESSSIACLPKMIKFEFCLS
ncbi:hypothetical protein OGAPHI_001291 [Ogataea philodendri]|uniref:Uncharacterized protein n=1 Tax=Ogataea philodendri TaxID=1378263 RepID=A0A9P8T9Y1_9ASCO|nr:uncharacterized protein OGAPHI_001291 [Ogataea philodendri]KAH3670775.1 hypothetical protein OGAPHI_001291 [Ogataea philodendri]